MEHFYVSFVIPAASVFEISCGKTDTQTNAGENRTLSTADSVDNRVRDRRVR